MIHSGHIANRQQDRDKIAADIEAYLKSGKKIEKLKSNDRADPKSRIGFNNSGVKGL